MRQLCKQSHKLELEHIKGASGLPWSSATTTRIPTIEETSRAGLRVSLTLKFSKLISIIFITNMQLPNFLSHIPTVTPQALFIILALLAVRAAASPVPQGTGGAPGGGSTGGKP
jgi:hypothetical protein